MLTLMVSVLTLSRAPTAEAALFDVPKNVAIKPWPRSVANGTDFDWQKLVPNADLNWVDCYTGRECARLEVPLDYSAPNGEKAAVALLRVKSKVSPKSLDYRGPILFNPGGPGESGVLFIEQQGDMFQKLLGDGYDIVGFDPRGIGETTPSVSVFSNAAERGAWDAGAPPLLNSTADALPRAFSRALLFNQLVESRSKDAAQHVSTAVVARDMLSIVKAHGRDKLQYWGVSYGTVLGATYAAMFPEKVERLVIDGVVNFDDYFFGSLASSLADADKALEFVYDKCVSAGPAQCPLHANSSTMIRQRVDSILTSLQTNPVPVVDNTSYGLIDFTVAKEGLFNSLASPFTVLPLFFEALAALEQGNGIPALTLLRSIEPLPKCNSPRQLGSSGLEASLAVRCGDATHVANTTADIMQVFEQASKLSIFADVRVDLTYTSCAGWRVQPRERYTGPFTVNTSFPLLVIGNTADPVTPLAGAQKATRGFAGSGLLTVNTPGHTSLAATSSCADNVVRNYFMQGQLPATGTVCQIDNSLFGQNATTS